MGGIKVNHNWVIIMAVQNQKQAGAPKRALRVSSKIAPQITKYYLKISKRYQTACALFIIVLLIYLVFILGAYGEYITYDNLQYLLRDLDTMASTGESSFSHIKYNKQSEQTFAVFKNGLATAGKESVSLFDSSGLLLCEDQISCNDPVLVPSEKYLMLYDIGGNSYSIYNSITRVISRQTDYKIVDGDMSDSGAFILVTRSNETKYVVELYNSALNHTMSIYKDNYIMDTAISSDGKLIVVCSAVPAETDFNCEIALYAEGNSEIYNKIVLSQTMPLYVHFLEDSFAVLCDNGLYFYDKDGVEISSYLFSGMTLEYADLSDEYTVIAGSENALGSENRIMVFAKDGSLLYNDIVKERVNSVCAPISQSGDAIAYILTPETVIQLSVSGNGEESEFTAKKENIREEDVLSIRAAGTGIVTCTSTGAYYLFQ